MKRKENSQGKYQSALNSAALQDHLLKKGNYKIDALPFQKQVFRPPAKTSSSVCTSSVSVANSNIGSGLTLPSLKKPQKAVSILPYESEQIKKLKELASEQVKLHQYKQKLTLAQRMGIISAPPPPLSASEWEKIEQLSKKRKDSQNVCSICLEDFRLTPQTILSCSHVFHMGCLQSFERHNKAAVCPICRRKDYEKKVIDEGIRVFTMKCILRIQANIRGSRCRKQLYEGLLRDGYKAMSKLFGRRLLAYKMWRLSRKLHERSRQNQQAYKKLMDTVERQFKQNNEQLFEDLVQYQRSKIKNTEELNDYLQKAGKAAHTQSPSEKHEQEKLWEAARDNAMKRTDHTCSICLANLFPKQVYLLSCSHMFHVNCINSFERYSQPNNLCPCCRSRYEKRVFKPAHH